MLSKAPVTFDGQSELFKVIRPRRSLGHPKGTARPIDWLNKAHQKNPDSNPNEVKTLAKSSGQSPSVLKAHPNSVTKFDFNH